MGDWEQAGLSSFSAPVILSVPGCVRPGMCAASATFLMSPDTGGKTVDVPVECAPP